jgi:hypothetical protein
VTHRPGAVNSAAATQRLLYLRGARFSMVAAYRDDAK